jgi:hypothetical protein
LRIADEVLNRLMNGEEPDKTRASCARVRRDRCGKNRNQLGASKDNLGDGRATSERVHTHRNLNLYLSSSVSDLPLSQKLSKKVKQDLARLQSETLGINTNSSYPQKRALVSSYELTM